MLQMGQGKEEYPSQKKFLGSYPSVSPLPFSCYEARQHLARSCEGGNAAWKSAKTSCSGCMSGCNSSACLRTASKSNLAKGKFLDSYTCMPEKRPSQSASALTLRTLIT